MPLDASLKNKIQQWLLNQHVQVPDDWMEACLEWLQNENQANPNNLVLLQKLVLEQWLMTDLQELRVRIIPDEVFSDKYTLNGIYSLQLNSIVDISQPFYGQLLQVQKMDTSNTTVSAETQTTQKPWEEKPSRMLMMKLSDGVVEVSGMEYRNIHFLNNSLAPGCKVQIKGPIVCRRGVLMLAQNNLQILGGEVEELFQTHNREAVLCSCLGRPPPAPRNPAVEPQNNPELDLPDDLISQLTDDAFSPIHDSGYVTGVTSNQLSANITHNPTPNPSSNVDFSEDNDISDMDMLEEMERLESSRVQSEFSSFQAPSSTSYTPGNEPGINSNETRTFDSTAVVDLTDVSDSSFSFNTQRRIDKQLSIEDAFRQNSTTLSTSSRTGEDSSCELKNGAVSKHFEPFNDPKCHSDSNIESKLRIKRKRTETELNSCALLLKTEATTQKCVKNNQNSSVFCSPTPELHCRSGEYSRLNELREDATAHIRGYLQPKLNAPDLPYKCLCQVQDLKKLQEGSRAFLVKASILTLLSKLQSDVTTGWSLKARIFDGTGMLDVQFSDSVLTELIGYSCQQVEEAKLQGDMIQSLNARKGRVQCRDAIIEMCKVMEIMIDPKSSCPIVCRLLDADQRYWDSLS